jgi:hypothetical protein
MVVPVGIVRGGFGMEGVPGHVSSLWFIVYCFWLGRFMFEGVYMVGRDFYLFVDFDWGWISLTLFVIARILPVFIVDKSRQGLMLVWNCIGQDEDRQCPLSRYEPEPVCC